MSNYASEAGHWYDPKTGEPRYTYKNAKGEEKNTTLREARKFGWVPSVTGIMDLAMRWSLVDWMVDQGILAALTMPRRENEPDEILLERIKADSKEQARKARERGTEIHKWVEMGFKGLYVDDEPGAAPDTTFFESARDTIFKEFPFHLKWNTEQSFAYDGYGGKCDLHTDSIVIDIKTTDKDIKSLKTWDEHAMQLAAYREGLGLEGADCYILYINTKTAESRLIRIPEDELIKGWACFKALKEYFYAKNRL